MSSTKLLVLGLVLAAVAYMFAASTASINPSALLAAVTTPSLKVVSPNGGETWAKGSTHTITWSGGASGWKVDVLLKNASTTNTVITIASSTSNTGYLTWKVPTTVKSRSYNIRIRCTNCATGTSGVTDISDAPFSIVDTVPTPDVTANPVTMSAAEAVIGTPLTFSGSINNVGTGSITNVPNLFRILSPSGYQVFALLPAGTLASVSAGAANVPVTSVSYKATEIGTYTVALCANTSTADVFGKTPANTTEPLAAAGNNCGPMSTFVVTTASTPDLVANSLTVVNGSGNATSTSTFYAGESIFLYGSVSNLGTAATNIPSVFRVRNQLGTTTYARVSAGTLASIGAGALGVPITSAVYSTTTPGTYVIDLCANMNTVGTVPANKAEALAVANNNCGPYTTISVKPAAAVAEIKNFAWSVPSPGSLIDFYFTVTATNGNFDVRSSSIVSEVSGTATVAPAALSKVSGTATTNTAGVSYTVTAGNTATFLVRYGITGANGTSANVTMTSVAGQAVPSEKQLSPTAILNIQ